MCGIGGAWFGKNVDRGFIERLILDCERRGVDAFGASIITGDGHATTFRIAVKASTAITGKMWEAFISSLRPRDLLIFNTRAQPLTEHESSGTRTVQPVETGRFVAVHNGVVANDFELTASEHLERKSEIDSEVIPLLVEKHGIYNAFGMMSGGFAVALADKAVDVELHLIKDFKTLACGYRKERGGVFAFASELGSLQRAFEVEGVLFDPVAYEILPPYSATTIKFAWEGPVIAWRAEIKTKPICSLPKQSHLRAVVCSSGGIDSTTAAYVAKRVHGCMSVELVHFDHGQKSEDREWEAVQGIAKRLGASSRKLDFKWLGALGNSVLTDPTLAVPEATAEHIKSTICWSPARNLAMMSALAAVAEADGAAFIYAGWSLEEEGCLVEDPRNAIKMADGTTKTPVEVKKGDVLLGWDGIQKELLPTVVQECMTYRAAGHFVVTLDGASRKVRNQYAESGVVTEHKTLLPSAKHPWFVKGVGWVETKDLRAGQVIFEFKNAFQSVRSKGQGNPWFGKTRSGEANPMSGHVRSLTDICWCGRLHKAPRPEILSKTISKAFTNEAIRQNVRKGLQKFLKTPEAAEWKKGHGRRLRKLAAAYKSRGEKWGGARNPEAVSRGLRKAIIEGRLNPATNLPKPTSLEKKFIAFFAKWDLPVRYVGDGQIWITARGKHMNPDFINMEQRKIVEVWGPYWHKEEERPERIGAFADVGWDCMILKEEDLASEESAARRIADFLGLKRELSNGWTVAKIEWVPGEVEVHNFHCEPHNNFFVNGLLSHNSYPDNSIDFFRTFNDCLDYGTIMRPKVRLPLARLMKKETVLLGNYLDVPYDLTWSCDNGDPAGHCGRCGACFLHHYSFLLAGLPDPTRYANPLNFPFKPPWEKEGFQATSVPMAAILRKMG
jgi:7-cyano-7-deazaguanine synthase in queuosine biosynthesis